MLPASWEEIRRLACDLERVQSSSAPKLTEQNCIELVTQLRQCNLLDVLSTTDGKSYVTPTQLVKEIYAEIDQQNGRLCVTDLPNILGVSSVVIDSKVYEMTAKDAALHLCEGLLISDRYIQYLAKEIREHLAVDGQLTFGEIALLHDLPTRFISSVITTWGKDCFRDVHIVNDTMYTNAFEQRNKANLRGYCTAVIRPVAISFLALQLHIQERLAFRILGELLASDRLKGSIISSNAAFVPDIFTVWHNAWVLNFFEQNRYLEYSILKSGGVVNPKDFLQKLLPSDVIYLTDCCLDPTYTVQLTNSVEDCITNSSWVDLASLLPHGLVCLSDLTKLIHPTISRLDPNAHFLASSIVVSSGCFDRCRRQFEPIMLRRAEEFLSENPDYFCNPDISRIESPRNRRDRSMTNSPQVRRRNRSTTNSPQRRRERSATASPKVQRDKRNNSKHSDYQRKAVKNKYLTERNSQCEDTELVENEGLIPFMSIAEMKDVMQKHLSTEAPDELITELTDQLSRPLLKRFQDVIRSLFFRDFQQSSQEHSGSNELHETITSLVNQIRIYEKGAQYFTQTIKNCLLHHILRTLGGEIVRWFVYCFAEQNRISLPKERFDCWTYQSCYLLLKQCPDSVLTSQLLELNEQTQRSDEIDSLSPFILDVDKIALTHFFFNIRQWDRRRQKTFCSEMAASLGKRIGSNDSSQQPQESLVLAVELLCHGITNLPVKVPSDCLTDLIFWLEPHLSSDKFNLLEKYVRADDTVDSTIIRRDMQFVITGWRRLGRASSAERDL